VIDAYRIRLPGAAGPIPLENRADLLDDVDLVLVMGCPRSGTTFLLHCLASLPRALARSGILVPERLCHVVGAAEDGDPRTDDILWSFRDSLWKTFVSGITSRSFHARDARRHPRRSAAALAVLAGRREVELERYVLAYKEPFMAFAAERLAAHFRGARILHLIRDGRDCADSLDRAYGSALSDEVLRADGDLWRRVGSEIGVARRVGGSMVPWWVPAGREQEFLSASRIERYLWMWQAAVERGRAARAIAGERYLEIRYEELCRDPRATGRAIREFLGVPASRRFERALSRARTGSVGISAARGREEPRPPEAAALLRELGYIR
jgi:hypothetical protein